MREIIGICRIEPLHFRRFPRASSHRRTLPSTVSSIARTGIDPAQRCAMLPTVSSAPPPSWVADLRAQGMTAKWSGHEHCWVRFKRFGHLRYPTNDVSPLTAVARRDLLWRHRLPVLQYHEMAGDQSPNASLYLCAERGYGMDSLSSNNRSKVRRGLKRLEVRQVTADEVEAAGYDAYCDTRERHGNAMMSPDEFRDNWRRQRVVPSREIWAAWAGSEIAAFGTVHRCGTWAAISATVSDRRHQRNYPNHALFFTILEHLMGSGSFESVSYGLSSLRTETDRDSLHHFKTSIGLRSVPVHRHVVVHPLLWPAVNRGGLAVARLVERRVPAASIPRATRAALEFFLSPDGDDADGVDADLSRA